MKTAYIKYIASLLIFGLNGIVASNISLSSSKIVLLRTTLGAAFLVVLLFAAKGKLHLAENKRDVLLVLGSGVCMGISWILLFEGYKTVGVGIASLLYCCGPVIVMALSPLLFKERFTAVKLIGFAAVLCGIALINGGAFSEGGNARGVIISFCSAVMYAAMLILNKKSRSLEGIQKTALQLCAALAAVAIYVAVSESYSFPIGGNEWLWVLVLGLVNTGFACWLYFSSVGDLPIQSVSVCGYIEPLSALLFSAILLGERMSAAQIFGAVLVIGGALFAELMGHKALRKE